jgi:formate dehydrogenase accessory protein FdhD
MITRHIKIKELDVKSLKLSSNSDSVLIEIPVQITHLGQTHSFYTTPTQLNELVHGFSYCNDASHSHITVTNKSHHYTVESTAGIMALPNFSELTPSQLSIQSIVSTVREFKSNQPIYSTTGATHSIGMLTSDQRVLTIEDSSIQTAFYKLIGECILTQPVLFPAIFVSHTLTLPTLELLLTLPVQLIVCQSAVSAAVIDRCTDQNITLFGFCRKRSYNRYTNFHY